MPSAMSKESPLTDPLEALGDSVFLNVLSHVPPATLVAATAVSKSWRTHSHSHRATIWRDAAWRCGMIAGYIQMDLDMELGQRFTANWERECRTVLLESRNRRFGRCRDRWAVKAENVGKVWQFRVNDIGRSVFTTNQDFGLKIREVWSGHTVYIMLGVRPFANVESCFGFMIVDPYKGKDTMHVFRTSLGLDHHERKYSFAHSLPITATTSLSLEKTWWPEMALAPGYRTRTATQKELDTQMPRDALAFDREICPPTYCSVFRARTHRRLSDDRRSFLGAAGEEGVYIWDLEDDLRDPDVYVFPAGLQIGVKSLEMDNDYVFVCGIQQLHIFDRYTKHHLLAYPPTPATLEDMCAAVYSVDMSSTEVTPVHPAPLYETPPTHQPSTDPLSRMGQIDISGYRSSASRYPKKMSGGDAKPSAGEGVCWTSVAPSEEADLYTQQRGFLVCRHTPSDLIYANRVGHLLITRDYASVLAIPDPIQRQKRWAEQTILISLGEKIRLLETSDSGHITFSTTKRIIFLDSSALPHLPLSPSKPQKTGDPSLSTPSADAPLPPIRLHFALGLSEIEANSAICVDSWDNTFYYSYVAQPAGRPPLRPAEIVEGNRNDSGPGSWIRGWDFGAYETIAEDLELAAQET